MRWTLPLLALMALCSLPLQAAVYTYIGKDGSRVFTDQGDIEGATRVEVRPPNVSSPTTAVKKLSPPPPEQAPEEPPELVYDTLRIAMPAADAAIQSNDGGLVVVLESAPDLQPGHLYRLEMDGQVQGTPQRSPVFTLQALDRGTHQLAGEIVDQRGEVLERTPAQPVHIQRISLDQRRRVAGCKEADYGKRPECPEYLRPKS